MTNQQVRLAAALADRYAIERELGQGGMATVYLAEDLKHRRKVALKVLKPELAAVLGAERFVQEITTTASLQHPHILPLFDSGEAESFLYYVMPYIEGETLRDKLDREKQLGIEEAVRITTEVADALDYAHRHNVIHRDIKPENILLHDGRPMVADFGIALAVSAAAGGRMTETGLSLGTPHYMSPEQATAEKDLMLYEMLTGDPPHTGSTAQQVIAKIITEDAAPITSARKAVPPNVAAAVAQALEKLAADRFRSAQEFAAALGNAAFAPAQMGEAGRSWGTRSGLREWFFDPRSIALSVVALGTVGLWLLTRSSPPSDLDPASASFAVKPAPGEQLVSEPPAISPDGHTIVYVVRDSVAQRLRFQRLDEFESRHIPGTEGARRPFFSADGERVGFWVGGNQVAVLPITGGKPEIVGTLPIWGDKPVWAPDGRIYVGELESGIWTLRDGQREAEQVTFPDVDRGEQAHFAPRPLPGGKLLFTVLTDSGMALATLAEGGASHEPLPLTVDGPAEYVAPGLLVFPSAGRVWAVAFDPHTRRLRGTPRPIDDLVVAQFVGYWEGAPAVGGATLAYINVPEDVVRGLVWVDRAGRRTPIDGIEGGLRWPRLAPDGRRVALGGVGNDVVDIWVVDLATTTRVRLSSPAPFHTEPVWTPDGRRVTYSRGGDRFSSLWWRPADGSGQSELLHEASFETWPTDWSPDGTELLFYGTRGVPPVDDIFVVDLEGNQRVVVGGPGDQRGGRFSPDGRWIAYQSSETGRYQVYVQSYPALDRKWPVSVEGGTEPIWGPNGRELFFRNEDRLMVVAVATDSAFVAGPPRELFRGVWFNDPGGDQSYDVSPDGQRFLMVDPGAHTGVELRVIVDWGGRLAARLQE
jgi:serine/threonine-protein kinase